MREPLSDVNLNELINSNYEALKVVTASYVAKLASPDDAIRANQVFHAIAEEIDDARTDFILLMREAEVEAEVVDDDDQPLINPSEAGVDLADEDHRGWPEEALQG